MRTLSSMIADVRSQTGEVYSAVDRLRNASRRLTGYTGEAPTPIAAGKGGVAIAPEPDRPLLEQLNVELERLNNATADLRGEMNHVESYSETGDPGVEAAAYAAKGIGSSIGGAVSQYRT